MRNSTIIFTLIFLTFSIIGRPIHAEAKEGHFTTPFKNIFCSYGTGSKDADNWVVCYIDKLKVQSYKKAPKACADEGLENEFNGHTFGLSGSGRGQLECDPDYPPVNFKSIRWTTISYGKKVVIGNIVCNVGTSKTPLTCVNSVRHGFSISMNKQVIF